MPDESAGSAKSSVVHGRQQTGSLRHRLVLAIEAALVAAAVLACGFVVWLQDTDRHPLLLNRLQGAAQALKRKVDGLQEGVTRVVGTVAALPSIQGAPMEDRTRTALNEIAFLNRLTDLVVLDAAGTVVFDFRAEDGEGRNLHPFLAAFDTASLVPQHLVLINQTHGPSVLAAARAPILVAGRLTGQVLASVRSGNELCDEVAWQQGCDISILLPGRVYGTYTRVLTSLRTGGKRQQGTAIVPSSSYDLPDGSVIQSPAPHQFGLYFPVSLSRESLIWAEVVTASDTTGALPDQSFNNVLAVCLLMLTAGLLVAVFLANRIARPLVALRRSAERLTRGESLSEPVEVTSADEVGLLAEAFNDLTRSLRARTLDFSAAKERLVEDNEDLEHERHEIECLLDAIPEGMLVLDPDGRISRVNETATRMLELNRQGLLGCTVAEVLPVRQADGEALDLPSSGLVEGFLDRGRRQRLPVEIYVVALQKPGAQQAGRLVILRDMARKFEVDQLKDDFLAIFTHQLKSPINALIGYAQILRESKLSPENEEIVDTMKSVGDFLSLQINNILASSRLKAGRMKYRLEHFPVMMSFEGMTRLFAPVAHTRDITLLFDPPGDTFAYADIEKVNDILSNLISNALKFTPAGGTILVASCIEGDRVGLRVSDTGQGIPEDQLSGLSQKFFQVTGEGKGSGLGLYISRTLAEQMNGVLEVQSVPREGSTFTVWLPLGDAEQAGRAAPSVPAIVAPILVADADRDWNGFLRLFLERHGVHRVGQAFNATELRTALERDSYDAIVLGESLGERSGWAVARDLRSRPATRDIPILYVGTSLRDDPTGLVFTQLVRPIEPTAVVARLRHMLAHLSKGSGPSGASVTPLRPLNREIRGTRGGVSPEDVEETIDRR